MTENGQDGEPLQDNNNKTINLNGFKTKNACYELTFLINNTPVKAMVDSGSTVNCVSTEVIDKLLLINPSKTDNDIKISSLGDVYSINSSIADKNSNVKYYATLKISFDDQENSGKLWKESIDAIMFGKLDRYEMIIGIPFLKSYGNLIDWTTGKFYPFGRR